MDQVVDLTADVTDLFLGGTGVVIVHRVDEEHGYVELLGQVLKPFGELIADVVAAQHKIGLGHVVALRLQRIHVGQAGAGVGTDIHVVARRLGVLKQLLGLVAGSQAGGLVFRIDDIQAQCLRDLLGNIEADQPIFSPRALASMVSW